MIYNDADHRHPSLTVHNALEINPLTLRTIVSKASVCKIFLSMHFLIVWFNDNIFCIVFWMDANYCKNQIY